MKKFKVGDRVSFAPSKDRQFLYVNDGLYYGARGTIKDAGLDYLNWLGIEFDGVDGKRAIHVEDVSSITLKERLGL